jgi:hypothetical protein
MVDDLFLRKPALIKKRASDGDRRPVLTSETTKRKKLAIC